MNVHLPALPPNIDDIVAGHDKALELYREAFDAIEAADRAVKRAYEEIERVTPGWHFHSERDAHEIDDFHKAVQMPERSSYMATAAKLLTLRCWHYVIDKCGLQQLMDAQAKKEFDAHLRYVPERPRHRREVIDDEEILKGPPPFTSDNVRATMQTFAGDAQNIWRRGIANAFSKLDRRFKSHDGFKVGSRMILTHFASYDSGRVDTWGDTAETFRDIERTFKILDGENPRHSRSDFLWKVNEERKGKWDPHQSKHYGEYFRVDVFKNGNAHLWFTRDDLVEKVNKELAAYYGEVIADGNQTEEDLFANKALTPARAFGFYPTSSKLAEKIARLVRYSETPKRILEPSAGTGNLAFAIAEPFEWSTGWGENKHSKMVQHVVDAVEIQPNLAQILRAPGLLNSVTSTDFLKMEPTPHKLYDGVVMNPPFDRERDIDHVTHALKFVKEGGFLVSIMSAGVEFRETRKAAAFRKLISDRKGWIYDLPPGSFADVGTNVNTILVGFGCREPWRGDF